ncbi:MAG: hypothetical protein AAGB93_15195 [Planctomycetota bacterium]
MTDAPSDKSFLARNWPWIVIPALVVAIGVALLLAMDGGDPDAGFVYPL